MARNLSGSSKPDVIVIKLVWIKRSLLVLVVFVLLTVVIPLLWPEVLARWAMNSVNSYLTALKENRPSDASNLLRLADDAVITNGYTSRLSQEQILDWSLNAPVQQYTSECNCVEVCGNIQTPEGWLPLELFLRRSETEWVVYNGAIGPEFYEEPYHPKNYCRFR